MPNSKESNKKKSESQLSEIASLLPKLKPFQRKIK